MICEQIKAKFNFSMYTNSFKGSTIMSLKVYMEGGLASPASNQDVGSIKVTSGKNVNGLGENPLTRGFEWVAGGINYASRGLNYVGDFLFDLTERSLRKANSLSDLTGKSVRRGYGSGGIINWSFSMYEK